MKNAFTEDQIKALTGLGISRLQSILYLTSLRYGVLSVLELSQKTGITRQQIYEEAEKLVGLGLYDITRKDRRKYIPALPTKLISVGKRKIEESEMIMAQLANILPSLESLTLPKKNRVTLKYYEGIDRIREGYEDELLLAKGAEIISFAGSLDDIFKFFPEQYWDRWNKTLAKQKGNARMLVHYSKTAEKSASFDAEYNRETRYLHSFPMKANIDVFQNIAYLVSPYDELGIWVESPMIANSYRIIFDSLWDLATPFD